MDKIKRLFNIATSLCEVNEWTPKRIDIQAYSAGPGFNGYALYLTVDDKEFLVRTDGTFERVKG